MAFSFSNLFKKKDTSVIGIDIGSSAIKVVQLRKSKGKAILETYGALALGPYAGTQTGKATNLPNDKIVEALKDILKEAKTTSSVGGIAIPFAASLMTVIELPYVNDKQIAQTIPMEARKYIPVPITEVKLDWTIMPKDEFAKGGNAPAPEVEESKVPRADVLLVAIHNETISKYQEIVSKAAIGVDFFEIEIFSTLRSVLDETKGPAMILDFGAATTKLFIVERGVVKNSHTINKGSQDITSTVATALNISVEQAEIMKRTVGVAQGEASKEMIDAVSIPLDHIFSDAKRVLTNYQSKYQRAVEKVILVGGGSTMKGFAEMAQKGLEAPVVLADPFSKVEAPAFLLNVLRKNGPEFAVALGLALRKLQED